MLHPRYESSHALVIGINDYLSVPPLRYAVSDAKAVAEALTTQFSFPATNVHLLLNEKATRAVIEDRYLSFACNGCDPIDRLVVFFAGHGHTITSHRGEVGYLVPWDGDPNNLASLIRWDTLTRNADLIAAKHILFIMDACYGGLAIKRALKPGAMRFMKDMLQRQSRQVLTAGKADEVVADGGGPLPDHSVFTGHLLEAWAGKAATVEGVLTANGVIAHVYRQVANDPNSEQTPHFGYLSGDGDLIFNHDLLSTLTPATPSNSREPEKDLLSEIPGVLMPAESKEQLTAAQQVKELLAEEKLRIRLHEFVSIKTRKALAATADDYFPVQGRWSLEEFVERLTKYESSFNELVLIHGLLGFWSEPYHRQVMQLASQRFAGRLTSSSGLTAWLQLRYYPLLLLMYASGIGAVAANKNDNLRDILLTPLRDPEEAAGPTVPLLLAVGSQMNQLNDAFKRLPGYERQYTPRSQYLFKLLQPILDDALFLGTEYEPIFDRFEVLYALEYAHQKHPEGTGHVWGPIGRFGWKGRWGSIGPFKAVFDEAEREGATWPVLKSGLFGGSHERFRKLAVSFNEGLNRLGWD